MYVVPSCKIFVLVIYSNVNEFEIFIYTTNISGRNWDEFAQYVLHCECVVEHRKTRNTKNIYSIYPFFLSNQNSIKSGEPKAKIKFILVFVLLACVDNG